MQCKIKGAVLPATAIAVLAAGGAAIAVAAGGDDALDRASAAALDQNGGGKVTEAEAATALALRAAAGVADSAKRAGELPKGGETVHLDPADFTTDIDNRYWPMKLGSRWVYRETDSEGTRRKVVVTVTDETKLIANGITARVVRDVVTEDGEFVEVTDDWYAQDKAGNIWYLGEATTEYENGKPVSTVGSFEAGVDGAQAGVIMPAHPRLGLGYRQEYYKGHAEDKASIVSRREQAEVPAGHYRRVLMTRDTNPLQRDILEFKFYARGVGPVLAVSVSGGSEREELISFTRADANDRHRGGPARPRANGPRTSSKPRRGTS